MVAPDLRLRIRALEVFARPRRVHRAPVSEPRGKALEMPPVHVELAHAVAGAPRARRVAARHGKSTQVCGRVLWELGRNPCLRVKIICAWTTVTWQDVSSSATPLTTTPRSTRSSRNSKRPLPGAADEFTIAWPGDVIGPTVAAFGVGLGLDRHAGRPANLRRRGRRPLALLAGGSRARR